MTAVLSNWRGYLELTKPGVQALLFVSCASGMLIGSDFNPPVEVFFFGLIGISFLAASSAVINHFFDQKIDAKMNRTSERPLVIGQISDQQAIIFSVLLYLSGSWMLLLFTNFLTWLLTTLTFIFYGFIYTKYLKFMTSQNIVIGGLAGAMPPLLGWSAITNTIEPNALLLVLIIMVWTPPHFWALALAKKDEYAAAKIPMLPVTHGDNFTRIHITLYTLMMSVCSFLPFLIGFSGKFYLFGSIVLNLFFLYLTISMQISKSNNLSFKIFNYSIIYLSALFGFMIADRYLNLLVIL